MSDLIWLSEAQMRRIEPYFPLSHGMPRVDDRRVISGIFAALAAKGGRPDQLMIDATHLKANRTAASLLKKGLVVPMIPRIIGSASLPDVSGGPKVA